MSQPPSSASGCRLVTVAHGTRVAAGNEVARAITAAAGERLGWAATTSYVELCDPLFADVMATNEATAAVVPLLLSQGMHVLEDLPEAAAGSPGPVLMGPALGPHPLLARAQVARLLEAGARRGQRVVLVAAGSTDPASDADLVAAAAVLEGAWGGEVALASLTGRGKRLEDVLQPGDAVSPYLLAEGFFSRKLAGVAEEAGAGVVAPVIGPHELVVELVAWRARALLGGVVDQAPESLVHQ